MGSPQMPMDSRKLLMGSRQHPMDKPQNPYGQPQAPYRQQAPYGQPQAPYGQPQPPKKRRRWPLMLAIVAGILVLACVGGIAAVVLAVNNSPAKTVSQQYYDAIEEPGLHQRLFASGPEYQADFPGTEPADQPAALHAGGPELRSGEGESEQLYHLQREYQFLK